MTSRFASELYFDIVLKIAERCNLACPYCYYFFSGYDPNARPALMNQDVVEALPNFLLQACEELNLTHLNVVFHGGEPLLYGKKRFRNLCEGLVTALSESPIVVRYGIQTNGLMLDDEWMSIFHKFGVRLGISIDGLKEFHDASRPDHKGHGSFDRVKRGLRIAQKSCETFGRAPPGAIAVVHPEMKVDCILPSLIDKLRIKNPNINFPRGGHDDPVAKRFDADPTFSAKLMNHYLGRYTSPEFHYIRGLSEFVVAMFSERGAKVNDKRSSTQHFIATIASDGEILPDDNLISSNPELATTGMTIFDTTLRSFIDSQFFWGLTQARDAVPRKCGDCEWFRVCRSGQMFNRVFAGQYDQESSICKSLQQIYLETARFLVDSEVISTQNLCRLLGSETTMHARDAHQNILAK